MTLKDLSLWLDKYKGMLHTFFAKVSVLKKQSLSLIEQLVVWSVVAFILFFVSFTFIIVPGVLEWQSFYADSDAMLSALYGSNGSTGKKYELSNLQKEHQVLQADISRKQKIELDKYNSALWKDKTIYDIAVYLEDYAVTFHTQDQPFVINNISFGKGVKISTAPDKLHFHNVSLDSDPKTIEKPDAPAEYIMIPMTVAIDAHPEKLKQFVDFVYHSGDTEEYLFKNAPVPIMSIESLSLPTEGNAEQSLPAEEKTLSKNYSLKMYFYMHKSSTIGTEEKSITPVNPSNTSKQTTAPADNE